jgi:hypothetical protein
LLGCLAEDETGCHQVLAIDLSADGIEDGLAGVDVIETPLANQLGSGGRTADRVNEHDLQGKTASELYRNVSDDGAVR